VLWEEACRLEEISVAEGREKVIMWSELPQPEDTNDMF
jgi:hypothetical protein